MPIWATLLMLSSNTGININDCTLKYTPNTFTAIDENEIRMLFSTKVVNDMTDCIRIDAMPTSYIPKIIFESGLKRLNLICSISFFL